MIPLFQNMSPTEDGFFDIRDKAPRKPAGEWDSPYAAYFPKNMTGQDLGEIRNSLLSHNFDPLLKDLELTYFSTSQGSTQLSEPDGVLGSANNQEKNHKWQVGLINPSLLRLSYENLASGQRFKLTCEAQTTGQGVALKMFRPLTSQLNLGISHETAQRQSQIQMDYTW